MLTKQENGPLECDICGQPKHRHQQIVGAGLICPVSAVTYRPKRATPTPLADKGLVEQQIDAILSDFAVAAIDAFKANDEGMIDAAMAEAKTGLAALSTQPAGDATDAEGVEEAARQLYSDETSNDPVIHCNRFPLWEELSEARRDEYRAKARTHPPKLAEAFIAALDEHSAGLGKLPMNDDERGVIRSLLATALSRTSQANEGEIERLREQTARLYCASGCSCCRDDEAWDMAASTLATLLGIPAYDDGSGYDWYSVRDAYDRKALSPSPDAEGEG